MTQRLSSVEDVKDFMSSKVSDLEGVIEKKGEVTVLKENGWGTLEKTHTRPHRTSSLSNVRMILVVRQASKAP